jgi:hypothetical protein
LAVRDGREHSPGRRRRISTGIDDTERAAGSEVNRDEFSLSLEQLQVAVARSCADGGPWADRFAGGVRAALAFAVANPTAARALLDSRIADPESARDHRDLIDHFSSQLRDCVPPDGRLAPASDEALLASIAGVVSGYLHSGGVDALDEVAPHLVYLALLPYVGFHEARVRSAPGTWTSSVSAYVEAD